jgi:hypothetical protein
MGLGFSSELESAKNGVIAALEVLAGAGVVYGGAKVTGAFINSSIGPMVVGTSVGFGVMMGGAYMAYDGATRVYPEWKADISFKNLALAAAGPYLMLEGSVLLGQGIGLNATPTLVGLVAQENYWLAVLGGTAATVGAFLTLDAVNQVYTFLPYGWNYRAGINIAMTAGSAVLGLAGAYKLSNDPGFNKFDLGLMVLAGAGLGYFGYKSYHEWLRYKGYVICPEDKKKHYLTGDWTKQDTYDAAIIKNTCAAQGAGQTDRDYRQEYFDRMKKLYEGNLKKINNKYNHDNKNGFNDGSEGTCPEGSTKKNVLGLYDCYDENDQLVKQLWKQPDSTTASTQNTTGSGLNTGNAKKAGKGK